MLAGCKFRTQIGAHYEKSKSAGNRSLAHFPIFVRALRFREFRSDGQTYDSVRGSGYRHIWSYLARADHLHQADVKQMIRSIQAFFRCLSEARMTKAELLKRKSLTDRSVGVLDMRTRLFRARYMRNKSCGHFCFFFNQRFEVQS